MSGETMGRVVEVAKRHVGPDVITQWTNPDLELSQLGIDSVRMVAFIVDLEKAFSTSIPEDKWCADSFRSLRSVTTLLEESIRDQ